MLQFQVVPVTAYQENCSIIWCDETNDGAIIDPGGEPELLKKAVEKLNVNIKKILITHGHLDHVGAAVELSKYYNAKIIGSAIEDQFLFDSLPEQCLQFSFPYIKEFHPDQWLKDGDNVQVGNASLAVLHCPGHTPGHVVFINAAQKQAWVGDVLFKGSIGRTDFVRSNHADLIASIKNKLLPLGDDIAFVPGHGPMSTFGCEKVSNPFL